MTFDKAKRTVNDQGVFCCLVYGNYSRLCEKLSSEARSSYEIATVQRLIRVLLN